MSTIETDIVSETTAENEAVLTVTASAARQVQYLIKKKGDLSLGLRVGVKGGGCSGLSYVMSLEPAPRGSDVTFEAHGIRIFVDPKSARFLAGTTLDYSIKNLLEGGWVWTNPNAGRTCGCGTSFTPKG